MSMYFAEGTKGSSASLSMRVGEGGVGGGGPGPEGQGPEVPGPSPHISFHSFHPVHPAVDQPHHGQVREVVDDVQAAVFLVQTEEVL
jgi:hypothetical protein